MKNTRKRFEVKYLRNTRSFGLISHVDGTSTVKCLPKKQAQKMIKNLAGILCT